MKYRTNYVARRSIYVSLLQILVLGGPWNLVASFLHPPRFLAVSPPLCHHTSATTLALTGNPICEYFQVDIPTSQSGPPRQAISVEDLTPKLVSLLEESGMQQGVVNVISRHTTTAITINEREKRLAEDMEKYFLSIAPPDERSEAPSATPGVRYFHNDIDRRPDGDEEAQRCRENGWNIDDEAILQSWRDQEPINAHSHLLSMLLGSSESIPVVDGKVGDTLRNCWRNQCTRERATTTTNLLTVPS